jgi:hypothetical protein
LGGQSQAQANAVRPSCSLHSSASLEPT